MNHWHLIKFKPNSHRVAEHHLRRQGFETFLPMQQITRRNLSRFVSELKPLFPGYMFVNVDTDEAPWRAINNTIGVSRLVCLEGKPKPLPLEIISSLMLRCDAAGTLLPPKSLNEGDSVEMLTGPFASFVATVDTIDPERRIWVLMDFMGQKTRIKVKMHQIKPTGW